ncbi:M14 family zinc carboxypeptidase [Undibacterium sp.]|uniref:M14 family zinc carboxypeptidase n=1 Tax=Undibacterium sp. TaxID=1914977 RepID=UPI002C2843BB|nr:M14 family zinc carboxypeptidase [Undibacterium sp.]HTD05805.1 M14 family zinc carboxypeptidase [Undibacterium sp.]
MPTLTQITAWAWGARSAILRSVGAIAVSLAALQGSASSLPAHAAGGAQAQQGKPAGDWCVPLAARLPKVSLNDCRDGQLLPTGAWSQNGFPILAREIAAGQRSGPALKVLLIGGIHGDELTASSIVFKWLALMQKPAAQEFQWKVAPVVNPDGLLAAKPRRVNARGVDLNRNFPTPNWQQDAPRYWAKVTASDPRRYPGSAPLSEPESRWVHDTIEQFKPDVIISVHAPFGVLDFDGPVKPPSRFGRLMFNRVGVYPGSLGNYSGLHRDIPVVTIELPNAQALPPDAEVLRIWQDMLGWIKRNVPRAAMPAMKP